MILLQMSLALSLALLFFVNFVFVFFLPRGLPGALQPCLPQPQPNDLLLPHPPACTSIDGLARPRGTLQGQYTDDVMKKRGE